MTPLTDFPEPQTKYVILEDGEGKRTLIWYNRAASFLKDKKSGERCTERFILVGYARKLAQAAGHLKNPVIKLGSLKLV